jgi:predicted XRE-type DNA-binding protein
MGTTLRDKIQNLPPERQATIQAMAEELISQEMALRAWQEARELAQARVAEQLNIDRDAAAQIEQSTELHLSALISAVRSMGGELELVVKFPDRPSVKLSGFQALDRSSLESAID